MRQPAAALGRFGVSVRRLALSALRTASKPGSLNRTRRPHHDEGSNSVNGTYDSSDFSSALANLDSSIEALQSQLDCLRAALDFNDKQVTASLAKADRHAAMLRDLIRAKRPDADWMDRGGLDQLIDGMEDATAEAQPVAAN